MSGRRIRSDCSRMAPCGKTSLTRCRKHSAGLEDCAECTLVNRLSSHWRIVNRMPERKCTVCGQWLPIHCFYPRTVIRNGRKYEGYEGRCKLCKVDTKKRSVIEVRQERLKFGSCLESQGIK